MLFEMEIETNQARNEIKEVFEDKLVLIEEKKQFDTCEISEIETIMGRDEIKEAFDKDLSTEETKNFDIRELETNKQRKRGTQDDKVEENKESFLGLMLTKIVPTRGYSSVVEHLTADREVHGLTPCAP